MRKCKYCKSEFVVWNWIRSPFWRTWIHNINRLHNWKFWRFFDRWMHECWNCNGVQTTFLKVKDGKPYEDAKNQFKYELRHEFRDEVEELQYLFHSAYGIWEQKHIDKRVNTVLESLKEIFIRLKEENKNKKSLDWDLSIAVEHTKTAIEEMKKKNKPIIKIE